MRGRARYLYSNELFIILAGIMLAGALAAIALYGLEIRQVLEMPSSRLFFALIFLNRLFALFFDPAQKKRSALLSMGVLVLVGGQWANDAFMVRGFAGPGVGESIPGIHARESGIFADTLDGPFSLESVSDGLPGPGRERDVTLSVRGREVAVKVGEPVRLSPSLSIKVASVGVAPRFLVKEMKERTRDSRFVKLNISGPGEREHFILPDMPHRVYLSISKEAPDAYDVWVQRGKLQWAEKAVGPDGFVFFDSFVLSFPETSYWCNIEVSYYPGDMVMIAGLLAILLGCVLVLANRGEAA